MNSRSGAKGAGSQPVSAKNRARTRSQMYAALACAFRTPKLVSASDKWTSLIPILAESALMIDAQGLSLAAGRLTSSLETATDQAQGPLRGLEIEYNRLFFGPARPQAPPYESVYRDSRALVMGPAARDVEKRYADAGLTIAPDFHDLPDHVATELGFMAYLAAQEAEAGEETATWLERQRTFLQEHLNAWLPRFCRRVQEVSQHPFYAALAELTDAFVALDVQWLEAGLREQTRAGATD